jgi:hypothetical protein
VIPNLAMIAGWVLALGAGADAGPTCPEPAAPIQLRVQPPSNEPGELQLTGRQLVRVVPRDLDAAHQPVALMPEEWAERYQAVGRQIATRLRVSRSESDGRLAGLRLVIARFDLKAWMGESELAPVGQEQMRGQAFSLGFDPRGPTGIVRLQESAGMDASGWAVAQPLAELVAVWAQLSFARLPEQPVAPGDCWSHTRPAPAAVPDVPGLDMEIFSFYLLAGFEPCGSRRCARIEEILQAHVLGQRQLGDSVIGVSLEGFGVVSHRVPVGSGGLGSAQGELAVEVEISSRPALGMPPDFVTRSRLDASWRRSDVP